MVRLSLKLLAHNILLKITKELRESRREIIYLARFLSVVLLISLHVVLCIYFGVFFLCAVLFNSLRVALFVSLFVVASEAFPELRDVVFEDVGFAADC